MTDTGARQNPGILGVCSRLSTAAALPAGPMPKAVYFLKNSI